MEHMCDLSIIVPARNEEFLARTIQDLLENIEGNTEIIVILDGYLPSPPLNFDDKRLKIIYNPISKGQRGSQNQAANLSTAKYLMKVDAHCAFDKGFDVKMMKEMHDDWTMVPVMYNLHAFNWKCLKCGNEVYQGQIPKECEKCDNVVDDNKYQGKFEKVIIWKPRISKRSECYRFDVTLHFQYYGERKRQTEGQDVCETMSIQGSCFMCTREKYWELGLADEGFGSWGQQGVEVACKTWLSGGKVMINKKTWYTHMFRTQGGSFGFPYPIKPSDQEYAREYSRKLFLYNNWPKQIYPLSWLLEKFNDPTLDWYQEAGKEMLKLVKDEGIKFYAR